ncbi:cytochrome c-type biogenesis protein CcmE [Endobacter medicaginis]|uniref:Cytochrome c-type biogenesis protein CcmE n=1 Tax=Endobacter medicaginis TaxID=1181271 RepID=A0A839UWA3_9PROT|nr:cytochrome c maturation protein CcmE [Endobacter medicaginis]MBB3174066.1 cytochrome c-type biogenesis protein CcmE [Endobacter medicaginis]MCX5476064.1 cytochrome c maturation protein CcmE [Endobacter medicaginis]NVN31700.1 cytochrome c maturation protein CcmE [Endobacter medicaginis]
MTRKSRRIWMIGCCGAGLSAALGLSLWALSGNIVYFMAPSQLLATHPSPKQVVRLGGMVEAGSVRTAEGLSGPEASFRVTDGQADVAVHYDGILPGLFREGQSVVALGSLGQDGRFTASEVLAKHDQTYMPREVADALRRSGKWDPRFGPAPDPASWDRMTAASAETRAGTGSGG